MIQSHYTTLNACQKIINYVIDPEKTSPELQGGVFCSPDTAVQEFLLTKALFRKESGRQIIHMAQSFAPTDNVTPELVKEIAERFLQHPSFKGYQVVYAVHTNKSHLHTHFVINTVNYETGLKWQQTKDDLAALKAYSDELCKEYGLSVIEKGVKRRESRGKYRVRAKQKSYLHEASLAMTVAVAHADSRGRFFANMKAMGYKVDWYSGLKDIMITVPTGQKVVAKSLTPYGQFTEENLDKIFGETILTKKDEKDFIKLLNKLDRLANNCSAEDMMPLSYLQNLEIKQAEQIEMVVTASELFLEIAFEPEDKSGNNHFARGGGKRSVGDIKDRLAEMKKGRGLDFEHDSV